MSGIETLKQTISRSIADHRKLAKAKFEPAIRPVYLTNQHSRPEHIGSCTLLQIRDTRYLLTAAHIIDDIAKGSLYIGGETRMVEIKADFHCTKKPQGSRAKDLYDFAIAPLPIKMLVEMGDVGFIPESELAAEPLSFEGHLWTALGYPHSKNKNIDHALRLAKFVIWPYSATVVADPAALAKKLGVPDNEHVFISFGKKSRTDDGQVVSSLAPQGISGGGLFDLGKLASVQATKAPPTTSNAKLAGLLIEHRKQFGAMISTRISTILRGLKAFGIL